MSIDLTTTELLQNPNDSINPITADEGTQNTNKNETQFETRYRHKYRCHDCDKIFVSSNLRTNPNVMTVSHKCGDKYTQKCIGKLYVGSRCRAKVRHPLVPCLVSITMEEYQGVVRAKTKAATHLDTDEIRKQIRIENAKQIESCANLAKEKSASMDVDETAKDPLSLPSLNGNHNSYTAWSEMLDCYSSPSTNLKTNRKSKAKVELRHDKVHDVKKVDDTKTVHDTQKVYDTNNNANSNNQLHDIKKVHKDNNHRTNNSNTIQQKFEEQIDNVNLVRHQALINSCQNDHNVEGVLDNSSVDNPNGNELLEDSGSDTESDNYEPTPPWKRYQNTSLKFNKVKPPSKTLPKLKTKNQSKPAAKKINANNTDIVQTKSKLEIKDEFKIKVERFEECDGLVVDYCENWDELTETMRNTEMVSNVSRSLWCLNIRKSIVNQIIVALTQFFVKQRVFVAEVARLFNSSLECASLGRWAAAYETMDKLSNIQEIRFVGAKSALFHCIHLLKILLCYMSHGQSDSAALYHSYYSKYNKSCPFPRIKNNIHLLVTTLHKSDVSIIGNQSRTIITV